MDKKSHIASLIRLAQADNVLNPIELMFIKAISIRIGVSDDDFNHIIQHLDAVPSKVPQSEQEKLEQLGELIVLMSVEKLDDQDELMFIEDIAQKMKIDSEKTKQIIEFVSKNKIDSNFKELIKDI